MSERQWDKAEVRGVLQRLHLDIFELTRTWPQADGDNQAEELCAVAARFVEQGDLIVRVKDPECFGEINQARADLGETIRRLFGAKNFGIISDDVYEIFRGRCKCCVRLLNELERSLNRHDACTGRAFSMAPDFSMVGDWIPEAQAAS